jgi:hypothetical protein
MPGLCGPVYLLIMTDFLFLKLSLHFTTLVNTLLFDMLTSIVSFIWAPSTRGGVTYGVKLTLYQSQQLPRLVGGALLRKQQDGGP